MKKEFIYAGKIVNTHGIRGEVKLNPSGFDPEYLTNFEFIYVAGKKMKVNSARVHKSTVLMMLEGINDMDAALTLKEKSVTFARTDAPIEEGDFFDEELIGCEVLNDETKEVIGKITDVIAYPAHNVWQVSGGEHEYLIPEVPDVFIKSVDIDNEIAVVHVMKGLALDEN